MEQVESFVLFGMELHVNVLAMSIEHLQHMLASQGMLAGRFAPDAWVNERRKGNC